MTDVAQALAGQLGLSGLVQGAGACAGVPPVLTGLSLDSRQTRPGHLFAAMPSASQNPAMHGARFVSYALRMGAVAVLCDAAGLALAQEQAGGPLPVPVLVADDVRAALARAAAGFYALQPQVMVAVTGTNGKTSVASFTRQIFTALGHKAVNLGTTGVEGAWQGPLGHTTPDPVTLHALLRDLARAGISHGAMEASSHGLDQRRLDGVRLRAAGFTNLSRDHMDYHPTPEAYFAAKAGLFDRVLPRGGAAVINIDDAHGPAMRLVAGHRGCPVLTVGRGAAADLRILGQRFDADGQELRFEHAGRAHQTRLGLIGGFQAENALVAAGLAIACDEAPEQVFAALASLGTVRGRMQPAAIRDNGARVFVDYAHTPDALATALRALRPHVMGRIVLVFGAGGDRDSGKRPLMGHAAAQNADVIYVTDDNPRTEDPAAIRAAIMATCPQATQVGDRAEAILRAVDAAGPGDAVLIAGKGHESGQIVGQDVLPFDDLEQASIAVQALAGRMA